MELNTLRDLFIAELSDIYSAEKQIIKALPKMIRNASDPDLKSALESHLTITERQLARLDDLFAGINETPKRKKCKGMEGLLSEADEMIKEDADQSVRDALIIAGAQKVEHYEIAAYGTLATYAKLLQLPNVELLVQNLEEEKEADLTLSDIAKRRVNLEAAA